MGGYLVILLNLLLAVVLLFRDWKYHDKRTKKHFYFNVVLIAAMICTATLLAYIQWKSNAESDILRRNIDGLVLSNKNLEAGNKELVDRSKQLMEGNRNLVAGNAELLEKIKEYVSTVTRKDSQIADLQRQVDRATTGVTVTYDFNGDKRTAGPGRMDVLVGDEFQTYEVLKKLDSEKKFYEEIQACQTAILKTPEWLTPHLVLGITYLNVGRKEDGIEQLKYVREHTLGREEYKQAAEILQQLGIQ